MKRLTIGAIALLMTASFCMAQSKNNKTPVSRQEAVKPTLPAFEMMNHIYHFNKASNSAAPLEKAAATMKTKMKLMGYGGANVMYVIDGTKANVRLLQTDTALFVINTGGAPAEYTLYKLETTKKERQAITQKASGMGFGNNAANGGLTIPYNTIQLKSGLYQLTPATKLEKGEYFFATKPSLSASNIDVFAFAID
ncbi:hypothetical protein ABDD95_18540 [Mucilaginibacter sp. PAMB04274]|uniref:hypothetical protein n=1 Tax=Mucilaginibacter sp. PAMB04274 TaxID=3138568 RepID=UPI0031F66458